MVDVNDAQAWFDLANQEYLYAAHDLDDSVSTFFPATCFHFHQAAEKALKAVILHEGKQFRKVHNLVELLQTIFEEGSSVQDLHDAAANLNPYYTDTRYPTHWPIDITHADAVRAKQDADRILAFAKIRMGTNQAP